MKNKLLLRIILDLVLFISALLGAWWLVFIIGIICTWYYRKFLEFPLAAFAFDLIYAAPRARLYNFEYVYTLIAIILFIIIIFLKSKVRKNLWPKSF
jgi:hypothetical protein